MTLWGNTRYSYFKDGEIEFQKGYSLAKVTQLVKWKARIQTEVVWPRVQILTYALKHLFRAWWHESLRGSWYAVFRERQDFLLVTILLLSHQKGAGPSRQGIWAAGQIPSTEKCHWATPGKDARVRYHLFVGKGGGREEIPQTKTCHLT